MDLKIVEERTNPLLKRKELRFEVGHATEATPTRDNVRTELAKEVHASKDRVIIERMRPRFGTAVTRGEANVYETADAAKSISREHILIRNGLKEKAAKSAAPAADAPAAAPAEAKAEAPAAKPAPEPPAAAPAPKAEDAAPAKPEADAKGGDAAKKPRAHAKKE